MFKNSATYFMFEDYFILHMLHEHDYGNTIYSHCPRRLLKLLLAEVKNKKWVGIFKNRLKETWLSRQVFVSAYTAQLYGLSRTVAEWG